MIIIAQTQDEKDGLAEYVAAKIGVSRAHLIGDMPFEAVAIERGGRGIGAVVYTNYRVNSIEMAWAGDPGWMTLSSLRSIFAYPFLQLECRRAWGVVAYSNKASRDVCWRLGCREIGILEGEFGDENGVLYEMTYDRCRWINPAHRKPEKRSPQHGRNIRQLGAKAA